MRRESRGTSLPEAEWIAVDWGTSNVRAFAIARDGRVVARASSERGMARLAPDDFEPALLDLIGAWLPAARRTLVVACGMVGARQGWIEVPYAETPCAPSAVLRARAPATGDLRLDVRIIAGVMQRDPPDVMRGEETQIAGALQMTPGFEGVVCLPGTHTKWALLRAGRIERFATCMTGELFALLSTRSVLRFSVAADGWDEPAFHDALRAAFDHPAQLAGALFAIRAGSLVAGLAPPAANARLSGLLIGAELAATRALWSDRAITIVDNGRQAALYREALRSLGGAPTTLSAEDATLAGLRAAHASLTDASPMDGGR